MVLNVEKRPSNGLLETEIVETACIAAVCEALKVLNEEALVKWIVETWPQGFGLFEPYPLEDQKTTAK
jgi:hypothetical protein